MKGYAIGKLKAKEIGTEKFVVKSIYACNWGDDEVLDNNDAKLKKDKTHTVKHAENQGYWQVVESVGQGEFPGVAMAKIGRAHV